MSYITSINLNKNLLNQIYVETFSNLFELLYLDLSNNRLKTLSAGSYFAKTSLIFLSLENNKLQSFSKNTFSGSQLIILKTDDYRLCCFVSSVTKCSATKVIFPSFEGILHNNSIKIILPFLSFGILVINCFSIILQAISFKKGFEKKGVFGAMLASLNTLDLSYSMPYFIMWSVYLFYGGAFVIKSHEWTSSTLCFTNFALITNYKFASPVLLSFITFSRLMVVKHPFNTKFKSIKYVFKCILFIFTLAAFCAACISTGQWKHVGNVPFKFCSPFIDQTDSVTIINILIGVIVIV